MESVANIQELIRENKRQADLILQLEMELITLKNELNQDYLTKAGSQRALLKLAEKRKEATNQIVVAFDLKGFGNYNIKYGHTEGDKALIMFVDRLKSVFRDSDVIYRRGGDEFVAILDVNGDYKRCKILERLDVFNISKLAYVGFSSNSTEILSEKINEAFKEVELLKRNKNL